MRNFIIGYSKRGIKNLRKNFCEIKKSDIKNGIFITATGGAGGLELIESIILNGTEKGYKFLVISPNHHSIYPQYCSIKNLNKKQKIRIILDKSDEKYTKLWTQESTGNVASVSEDVVFYSYEYNSNHKDIKNIVKLCPNHIVIYVNIEPKLIVVRENIIVLSNNIEHGLNHKFGKHIIMKTEGLVKDDLKTDLNPRNFNVGEFIDSQNYNILYQSYYNDKNYSTIGTEESFNPYENVLINVLE